MPKPLPKPPESLLPPPGVEADAHLASLRQALRAADMIAGKPPEQIARPVEFSQIWVHLPASTRRCFEARATRAARAAGRGLELIAGQPVHPSAAEVLSERLRADLARIEQLFADR